MPWCKRSQHNKSIRKALQKHGHTSDGNPNSSSSREEEKRGLSLQEFSMLYFAPVLKKHYGKAGQDLALAKGESVRFIQIDWNP